MNLSGQDYVLAIIAQKMAPLLRHLGDVETDFLRLRLDTVTIDRPIFITGLARSGTTILLNVLSQVQGVATHRYRDFPFLWIPATWNWFQERMSKAQPPVERPHRDRIRITKDSPEAFEEPIWQSFFPWVHDPRHAHVLNADVESEDFRSFFADHMRKILFIRGGGRYLSKGNYNIARIAYLARIFPDARFLVPIREPLAHVHSLVKQHRLFSDYAKADGRIAKYLKAAGHYEFGPQRQPINISGSSAARIVQAWQAGDDYRGYAALWSDVYEHIAQLTAADSALAKRILVIRYDALCENPHDMFSHIADFAHLQPGARVREELAAISAPRDETGRLSEEIRRLVRLETDAVAARFGYMA